MKREEVNNKKIYIIVSFTGTILSRIVKLWTRKEYSHASISLDDKLDNMYSFGRLNSYNPFLGGYVHESPKWGTFKRFKKTKCVIISINVTDIEYEKAKKEIDFMNKNNKSGRFYKFNYRGVIAAAFKKKFAQKDKYYCSEFVKHILDTANIKNNLPAAPRPMDYLNLERYDIVYKGKLSDY